MLSPKSEVFLNEVLSYVKFTFDRNDIRKELEGHISDKIEYYMELGSEPEEAEQLSVQDMGDAREIGIELNKQHNPVLGWIWRITGIIAALLILLFLFVIAMSMGSFFQKDLSKETPKADILYQIDIKEQIRIDDRIIRFTKVIMEESGELSIFYTYHNAGLLGGSWSLGYIGEILDDQGNKYVAMSGQQQGGIITKGMLTIPDFSRDADTLIISYDSYNRKYRIEIPLEAGETDEQN
ncbi:MAG TPA: hypothetical protein GXX75_02205 [Clostridiales bacterium]|nr:hypothetical protein [Clostridiales bacterium]